MSEWVLVMMLFTPTGEMMSRQIVANFQTIEQCSQEMKTRHNFLIQSGANEAKNTKFQCAKVQK
jgi:hypothetical protein